MSNATFILESANGNRKREVLTEAISVIGVGIVLGVIGFCLFAFWASESLRQLGF
jgi:hypothetical protein